MKHPLLLLIGFLGLCAIGILFYSSRPPGEQPPIKVGVLHSLSGTMKISEQSVVDATLLAIEEINRQGGVDGRRIEPVVVDGRSDWPTFAAEADRLILQENVRVIFGCWTSASRKEVKQVVERHDHLLFYPVQYEGLEQSPNIVYTGALPNQQIIPAVKWFFDHRGKKFFLVGSDYVFPRVANEVIKDYLGSLGGTVVGEEYIPLGSHQVSRVVQQIVGAKPDVILNTTNGDSNIPLFRELRAAGVTAQAVPTVSFSIAEVELRSIGAELLAGDYAAWNYFQSIDRPQNSRFVERFRNRWGKDRVVSDPMEAAYTGVHLWAKAVRAAGTDAPQAVRRAIPNQSMEAPQETVYVDMENQHLWKRARIGRIRPDGQFDIVWTSETITHPVPYPGFRTRAQWHGLLESLYLGWGKSWASLKTE
jgi:urea transport system substrate-binding protein